MPTAALVLLLSIPLIEPALAQDDGPRGLKGVRKIYVGDLGQIESAIFFRQELIARLTESGSVEVVGSPYEADATLDITVSQGSDNVHRTFGEGMTVGTEVIPFERLTFRLADRQDHAVWALKIKARSYSTLTEKQATELSKKVSRELLKAMEKERKRP